jgi:methionyl-tRNA formyltransferase
VQFKVWRTWPYGQPGLAPVPPEAADVAGHPGAVVALKTRLFAGCAEGAVELLSIQPDGKSRMTAAEFLRGYRGKLGPELATPSPGCDPATPRA